MNQPAVAGDLLAILDPVAWDEYTAHTKQSECWCRTLKPDRDLCDIGYALFKRATQPQVPFAQPSLWR